MPSIIPSYIYTLFASILVGTIIICTCGIAILNVRNQAEEQQLSNIAKDLASESTSLISKVGEADGNSSKWIIFPATISGKTYWIQFANDSSKTWIEFGLGNTIKPSENRIYLPFKIAVSGTFTSNSVQAFLYCQSEYGELQLTLSGAN